MGSKYRLLPWIHTILSGLDFTTALDAFSGSGSVSYLMKAMGKRVTSNDFLNFSATVCRGIIENSSARLEPQDIEFLLSYNPRHRRFIETTFAGIFYALEDLRFLDRVLWNVQHLDDAKRAIAISALVRSCVKRQPRGVFTVAGDPERYKDGRRDLQLSIRDHFVEQVQEYNSAVFSNGHNNEAVHGDVFDVAPDGHDLVYMDPPYVPRADDNCYMKRYHFLEGLSCYWEGMEILEESKVKKVKKLYTPFSYRRTAIDAFTKLFRRFAHSTLVLSYSSNGFPDLACLVDLMRRFKQKVEVYERSHQYHFGTHSRAQRNSVTEYLIVGN
ncbi:MAG: DNA adenine methylase [Candidatus Latescibacterota bacterium]|jgi:DNA adenine methylase/adenine-specific DNA-methyltransferase